MKIFPLHSNSYFFACAGGELNTIHVLNSSGQHGHGAVMYPYRDWRLVEKIHPNGVGTQYTALDVNGNVISGDNLVRLYKYLQLPTRLANYTGVQIVCQATNTGQLVGTMNPFRYEWQWYKDQPAAGGATSSASDDKKKIADLTEELNKAKEETTNKDNLINNEELEVKTQVMHDKDKELKKKDDEEICKITRDLMNAPKNKIEELNAATDLKDEIAKKDEEICKRNENLAASRSKIVELEAIIHKYGEEIAEKNEQLESKDKKIKDEEEEANRKRQELQAKNNKIEELEAIIIKDGEKEAAQKFQELEERNKKIEELEAIINKCKEDAAQKIQELEAIIKKGEKDDEIAAIKNQGLRPTVSSIVTTPPTTEGLSGGLLVEEIVTNSKDIKIAISLKIDLVKDDKSTNNIVQEKIDFMEQESKQKDNQLKAKDEEISELKKVINDRDKAIQKQSEELAKLIAQQLSNSMAPTQEPVKLDDIVSTLLIEKVQMKKQLDEVHNEKEAKGQQLEQKIEELNAKDEEVAKKDAELEAKNKHMIEMEDAMKKKLEEEIGNMTEELKKKEGELKEKDKAIVDQATQLEADKKLIDQKEKMIKKKDRQIKKQTNKVKVKIEQLGIAKAKIVKLRNALKEFTALDEDEDVDDDEDEEEEDEEN
ncbi:unnamed protein product [Linum trigynum]|uniref:Uncharacterized protein n=1 Tax=Linum trigynum TaxID=586398 RepID=A0AAV2DU41_9ROSI